MESTSKKLLPQTAKEFSDPEYWKEFFRKQGKAFEWYGDFNDLKEVLTNYIKETDAFLQLGCGNSKLAAELHESGYCRVHSIDLDEKVIEGQKKTNKNKKGLTFEVMNVTKLSVGDDSHNVVVDKGTLDALFPPTADSASLENVRNMFKEVVRVLKAGGRYLIVTLAQTHIIQEWVRFFSETKQFLIRLHKVENKANGFHIPVFVLVATKLRVISSIQMPFEVIRHGKQVIRCKTVEEIVEHVQAEQQLSNFVHMCSKRLEEEARISFYGDDLTKGKRYEFLVHDALRPKEVKNMAAFLVPLGRDKEWLYATKKGRSQVMRQMKVDRLIFVYLNRAQQYKNVASIKIETMAFLSKLDPRKGHQPYPYASVGANYDERTVVAEGISNFNGQWYVEDIVDSDLTVRRLIFANTINLIQSEAFLENGKVTHNKLACSFHKMMIAALSLNRKQPLQESHPTFKLLVLGVGGGLLTTFVHEFFANANITGVEIDKEVINIARDYFGMPQDSEKFEIKVMDALEYLGASANLPEDEKFDVIFMDVAGDDPSLTCPPEVFVQDEALANLKNSLADGGVTAINVVTRDDEVLEDVKKRLKRHFGEIRFVDDKEDVNKVLMCTKGTPVFLDYKNVPLVKLPESDILEFVARIRKFD